jgi:hypothetical protein
MVRTQPRRLQTNESLYFLHIPKTGGVTLGTLLETRFRRAEVCPIHQFDNLQMFPPPVYDSYRYFWGHFGMHLPEFLRRELVTITLLRDPIEQVISFYQHVRRDPSHYLFREVNGRQLTLDDFVRDPGMIPHIWNAQTHHLLWDSWLHSWYSSGALMQDGTMVPEFLAVRRARERLDRFAFFGLTERMGDSLRLLCHLFGWEGFETVPELNASPRRSSVDDIPDDTRYAIEEITLLDMELVRYARQVFQDRFAQFVKNRPADGGRPLTGMGRRAS